MGEKGGVEGEGVLGQGGVDAVLEHGADLGEGHAGAGQLALIAQVAGRDPDGGEGAEVEQGGQAGGVELIGLVDVAHHGLGPGGVGQQGQAAGLFDLVDDPIPVADSLQGDRSAGRELGEEGPDGTGLVVNASALNEVAEIVQDREQRVVLVRVTTDLIMGVIRHVAPPCATVASQLPV